MKTLKMPWPAPCLNPNSRKHWSVKAAARKKQRRDCGLLAAGTKPLRTIEIPITLTFCPPNNRRRDLDNMLASFKGGCDGLADAWGIDDHKFKLTIQRGPVVKHGAVLIEYQDA